jgi:hypothetical protein
MAPSASHDARSSSYGGFAVCDGVDLSGNAVPQSDCFTGTDM